MLNLRFILGLLAALLLLLGMFFPTLVNIVPRENLPMLGLGALIVLGLAAYWLKRIRLL